MLEIDDVLRAIADYQSGRASLGEFADWLRAASRKKFAESEEVRHAICEADSLYSEVCFGGMSEAKFREELASAIRPFARSSAEVWDAVYIDFRVESGNNSHQDTQPSTQTTGSNSSFGFSHA
jgi:hypothetical protein